VLAGETLEMWRLTDRVLPAPVRLDSINSRIVKSESADCSCRSRLINGGYNALDMAGLTHRVLRIFFAFHETFLDRFVGLGISQGTSMINIRRIACLVVFLPILDEDVLDLEQV
jgi:hypothetical protein